MQKNNKTELFETTPILKAVVTLAVPTIASSIVMVIYNLADTFFVGLINDPIETSAVTLAAPVILAFNAVTNLFGVGSSSLMSRALGIKDYDTVRKSSAFGIYCALICGLCFSLFTVIFNSGLLTLLGADSTTAGRTRDYLFWTVVCGAIPSILNMVMSNLVRAEGRSLEASVGVISGCLLNIILDPVFILPWGLNMGVAGAGCATFISNTVAMIYYIVFLFINRGKTYVCTNPSMAIPTKHIVREVFGVGIPASIQNLLNVTGMTILNNVTSVYGPEAVSAMGIAHKVALVPLYFSMGGGQGIMPLIGYNYSSGNRKRFNDTIRLSLKLVISTMFVAAAVMYIFAEPIIRLFMENPDIVTYGSGFLRGFTLAVPFLSIDFLAVAIFQACGKGSIAFIFAILRKIVLEIPAFLILNKIFGMYGLGYGQLIAEFTLAVISLILLIRMLRANDKILA